MDRTKTRLILVLTMTILIMGIIAFFYWDYVRDNIVVPIYYLLWLGDLAIKSVPQQVYLALLILVSFFVAVNTLVGVRIKPINERRVSTPPTDRTRYAHWKRLYRNLYGNPFFINDFASETRKLLLSLLAYQEGVDSKQVEAMILDGRLSVPAAVHHLVQHKKFSVSLYESNVVINTRFRLWHWFSRAESQPNPPETDQVSEVVAFIEHRMEIPHDGNKHAL